MIIPDANCTAELFTFRAHLAILFKRTCEKRAPFPDELMFGQRYCSMGLPLKPFRQFRRFFGSRETGRRWMTVRWRNIIGIGSCKFPSSPRNGHTPPRPPGVAICHPTKPAAAMCHPAMRTACNTTMPTVYTTAFRPSAGKMRARSELVWDARSPRREPWPANHIPNSTSPASQNRMPSTIELQEADTLPPILP